ncbi:MAG: hypothetical protein KBT88_03545 [Gammaproteobacteria bacterium]|nr:hypothetical protein [Gammaproteobacteria bacterium]MBQ0838835.1 hypothetical protein [Gammaproteobacteria bacterium]
MEFAEATDDQIRAAALGFLKMGPPAPGTCNKAGIDRAIERAQKCAFSSSSSRDSGGFMPLGGRAAFSLVKAAKSPTNDKIAQTEAAKLKFEVACAFNAGQHKRMLETGEIPAPVFVDVVEGRERVGHGAPGVQCIVEQRKWADEIRIRSQVETASGTAPPAQSGPRISDWLSDRGLRALTDSAGFVSATQGGYTTFVTLTFNDDGRERLAKGETTIQREASRCFDAWAKMYQRGLKRQGIAGNADDFDYLWVVEVPDNEAGEPNPHLHVLMRWAVPFAKFKGWSERLEGAWGQGFAHLEKIESGKGAAAYISKAIGYLCKAQGKADQGTVRGNRYGISKSARAPGWELMSRMQLDCMGQLIADIYDHLSFTNGPDYKQRQQLNRDTAALKAEGAVQRKKNNTKKSPGWIINKQRKVAKALAAVREKLDAIPVRASRYQLILKGEQAAKTFFKWAYHPTGSKSILPSDWLPEKPTGICFKPGEAPAGKQSLYFVKLRAQFHAMKRQRWAMPDSVSAWLFDEYESRKQERRESWYLYECYHRRGEMEA